jgi:hypothetical protein
MDKRDQTQKRQCRLLNVNNRLAIKIGCVNFLMLRSTYDLVAPADA